MEFGDILKRLREQENLTREDLSVALNITYSALSKYETNVRFPDKDTLKNIAKYFNVSIDYLLGFSDKITDKLENLDEKYPPVNDVEEAMQIIMSQQGLMLKGELLTDEDKIILANSIQNGLKLAEELRKKRREKMEGK